jgi:hypothetical protein
MLIQYITGLDQNDFDDLYDRISRITEPHPAKHGGPHEKLGLAEQIAATLMLARHNLTEELVASIFGVSQPTLSRIKDRIEPLINQACEPSDLGLEDLARNRQILVDGTYVPTGNRRQTGKTNYSGKRHCQCVSIQVASDRDGMMLAVSPVVAGARHDSKALELCGWKQILEHCLWIADTAYIGTNALTPIKKLRGYHGRKPINYSINLFLLCAVRLNAVSVI